MRLWFWELLGHPQTWYWWDQFLSSLAVNFNNVYCVSFWGIIWKAKHDPGSIYHEHDIVIHLYLNDCYILIFQQVAWEVCSGYVHIDGLVQERHNSIANTLKLYLCTNPSISSWFFLAFYTSCYCLKSISLGNVYVGLSCLQYCINSSRPAENCHNFLN